jgi:hypothetical protein
MTSKKQWINLKRFPYWILLMTLLASCSAITYNLDSYHSTFIGTLTKDAGLLGAVERVALVAFTAESSDMSDVEIIGPLVDLAYQQALVEMQAQSTLTFIPTDQVVENEAYASMRADLNPQVYSPVEGLTDLPEGISPAAIADLCDSLQVDALLFIRLEFDWKFPTVNAVTMRTRDHEFLIVPEDGKVVWEGLQTVWDETLVPVPADFKLILGMPNADEWAVIVEYAGKDPKVRALGGEQIFILVENAKQAR